MSARTTRLGALLIALLLSIPASALAAPDRHVFYNLTSDEAWRAGMALGHATRALEAGYAVTVFLNVRGVYLAQQGFATDRAGGAPDDLRGQLGALIDAGAEVMLCGMCLRKAGLEMADMLPGTVKVDCARSLAAMSAEDTVVISY
ncbi:DsrE family protein [Marichromatium gracile]|uniref:Putative peroxiredoxin n=1 Tax=Marichromatium gracile TaxID=1048 RepID=A0A4R4A8I4_MARGR|nr:DsrE family protein [Marichromatium gracile]MBK1708063.1 hypothetical protein [Marichromatium gracile]TCW35192.1 putative peroxiredoxin [Marichromatium gracile]